MCATHQALKTTPLIGLVIAGLPTPASSLLHAPEDLGTLGIKECQVVFLFVVLLL